MPTLPSDTREEITQRARNIIRGLVRGADVRNGSDYDLKARILAAVAFAMQSQASVIVRLLDPRKAFGVFLREFCDIQGVGGTLLETSIAAQKATGKVIILSSSGGQTQNNGSVLTHADGTTYTLTANATTSATATKTLRVGHRSGRRRLYQGHVGGGFINVSDNEVYRFTPTGEYCAIYGQSNGVYSSQYLFDLFNELDADPSMHDTFVQQFGTVASITATVGGKAGNKDAKDTLTIASPSGTIQATAHILNLSGGRDGLTASEMQAAIRDLQRSRLGTMTLEEIRNLGLSYPTTEMRECFVFPGKNGMGSYELLPIAKDGNFVNSTDLAEFDDYVAARVSPVDKFIVSTLEDVLDNLVTLEVRVAANLGPDWSLPSGGTTAVTVIGGSTVTRVNVSSVSGMEVGDRVIISCAQASDPYVPYIVQRRITAIDGGTPYIDLDSPLPYPPVAGQSFVTPGGPLGQAVIDALYAHYDAQSPSATNTSPFIRYYRYPAPESTENIQGLFAKVAAVEGVLDTYGYYSGTPSLQFNQVLVPGAVQIKMWV